MKENALLSLDETAAVLRLSRATVARRIREGQLRAVRIGRKYRISAAAIDALLAGVAA